MIQKFEFSKFDETFKNSHWDLRPYFPRKNEHLKQLFHPWIGCHYAPQPFKIENGHFVQKNYINKHFFLFYVLIGPKKIRSLGFGPKKSWEPPKRPKHPIFGGRRRRGQKSINSEKFEILTLARQDIELTHGTFFFAFKNFLNRNIVPQSQTY